MMRKVKPYVRRIVIGRIDGRTQMAKLARELRRELLGECSVRPTVIERAMIDQIIQLKLRIAAMDQRFIETGAKTDHDSRTYLAWSNSLVRLLRDLAAAKPKGRKKAPSVAQLLGGSGAKLNPDRPPSVADLLRSPDQGSATP
jgi:hypothetical protein